jgi:hypothetical protein
MELLIIKSGEQYLRVKDDQYLLVGLTKASVFPVEKLSLVKEHQAAAESAGFSELHLKKLILTEEDYQP